MVRYGEILLDLVNLFESQSQLGDGGQHGLSDSPGVSAVSQSRSQEPAQHDGAVLSQL